MKPNNGRSKRERDKCARKFLQFCLILRLARTVPALEFVGSMFSNVFDEIVSFTATLLLKRKTIRKIRNILSDMKTNTCKL